MTDDEIRDVSAMLMKKWLKRDAPGYERTRTDGVADIQKVTAVADTVIDVPEGTVKSRLSAAKSEIKRRITCE